MKLFVTEAGASYDPGMTYGPTVPSQNQLFAHAAVGARAQSLAGRRRAGVDPLLRCGYPGEPGYGTFFDLNNAQGAFGASNLSREPEALALPR